MHLAGVLAEAEVAEIEAVYDRFLRREIEVPGKDYCDMAGDYGREPEDFSIVNVMLPRRYYPQWQGNVYERRTAHIAAQLCGDGMTIDYDQLLAKQPYKDDADLRVAPGHGVLARHARPPHGDVLAGGRRLDTRERVHAVRAGDEATRPSCGRTPRSTAGGAPHMRSAPICVRATKWS